MQPACFLLSRLQMEYQTCGICLDVMCTVDQHLTSLTCAHVFHTCCLEELCTKTSTTLPAVRCPTCRRGPTHDVDGGHVPGAASGSSDPWVPAGEPNVIGAMLGMPRGPLVLDDEDDEADNDEGEETENDGEDEETEEDGDENDELGDAEPAAKAKSKGKAKSKPKAKAKSRAAAKAAAKAIAEPKATSKAAATPKPKGQAAAKPKAAGKAAAKPKAAGKAKPEAKRAGKAKAKAAAKPKAEPKAMAAPQAEHEQAAEVEQPEEINEPETVVEYNDEMAKLAFGRVKCETCGRDSDFSICRVIAKGRQAWRCNICGVKTTQLRRALGKWPSDRFNNMSQDGMGPLMRWLRNVLGQNSLPSCSLAAPPL